MKTIVKIDLHLEDCSVLEIPAGMWDELLVQNIHTEMIAIDNGSHEFEVCDGFAMILNEKAATHRVKHWSRTRMLFDVLTHNPAISAVEFTYDDETTKTLYVLWDDDCDFDSINPYEEIIWGSDNRLYIDISDEAHIADVQIPGWTDDCDCGGECCCCEAAENEIGF